jgi:hypothetical protein
MKILNKSLYIALTLAIVLILGCSDRSVDNTSSSVLQEGGIAPQNHVFYDEFIYQINNGFQLSQMAIYVPKVSFPHMNGGSLQPIPLLVLLTPEDANQYYYFNNGLKNLADQLISDGTIQPMAIACLSNDTYIGGFYYAGHFVQGGNYDAILDSSLITFLNRNYPFVIDLPGKRGIGGFGQGAYGALRSTIINPGNYGSISVVDGPLDFDGPDGTSGLMSFFDDALMEQGLMNGDIKQFKLRDSMNVSRMFIGGSYAFSPQDTSVFVSYNAIAKEFQLDSTQKIANVPGDSVTMVPISLSNPFPIYSYHLPFDNTGAAYAPIWNDLWLPNNLENLLTPGVLNGMNIWMGTSVETQFMNYHNQTQSFINTLSAEYPVEVYNYTGYDGKPATRGQYVYDLLREMLIFHSESFGE